MHAPPAEPLARFKYPYQRHLQCLGRSWRLQTPTGSRWRFAAESDLPRDELATACSFRTPTDSSDMVPGMSRSDAPHFQDAPGASSAGAVAETVQV
jgi:hypothetical protein